MLRQIFFRPITNVQIEYVTAHEPSDLFISYFRGSKETVDDVLAALSVIATDDVPGEQVSFKVFRDVESIRSGEYWDNVLTEAIFKTRVLVPFLCDNFLHSPTCMFELLLFLQRDHITYTVRQDTGEKRYFDNIAIVPYRIEECDIPAVIQRFNAPLIPADRPIPTPFINRMRFELASAIQESKTEILMSAEPVLTPDRELGRDFGGIRYPQFAADGVLRTCQIFLGEGVADLDCREAISAVADATAQFLKTL